MLRAGIAGLPIAAAFDQGMEKFKKMMREAVEEEGKEGPRTKRSAAQPQPNRPAPD